MKETLANATNATNSTTSSTRRTARVSSAIALGLGGLELLAGCVMWYLTATDPSDDPLVGLGYFVAIIVATPGVVAVVLGVLGWLFAERTAGLVLGVLGAVAAAGPFVLVLGFAVPGL